MNNNGCSPTVSNYTFSGNSADFDGNGSVGLSDLLVMLANWGPCP